MLKIKFLIKILFKGSICPKNYELKRFLWKNDKSIVKKVYSFFDNFFGISVKTLLRVKTIQETIKVNGNDKERFGNGTGTEQE